MLRRLIAPRHSAESDAKAVPRVDCGDGQGEIGQFFLAKMGAHLFKDLVWHMVKRDQGELLRPEQGGALAFAKERRLLPDGQRVEALLRFASRARNFTRSSNPGSRPQSAR